MSKFSTDELGGRLKRYEGFETERRLMPLLPIYARIDGKSFHSFTKGMERPFDPTLSSLMIETAKYLVEKTHAKIGYTQSDEISLIWKASEYKNNMLFDGRIQKANSVLASMATAVFTSLLLKSDLVTFASRLPHFDCRIISLPNDIEAANMVLWRTLDATKNAISMAARHYYSHSKLQNKNGAEMQEMLFAKGVNFNDYPVFFRRGTFVRREIEVRPLPDKVIQKLQAMGKSIELDATCERSIMRELDMPIFSKVINRVNVIFHGENPRTETDNDINGAIECRE